MKKDSGFHSSIGTNSFLGLRSRNAGVIEIVYDDGAAGRMVWRVNSPSATEARIGEALRLAVDQARVLPALYTELKKRSISIEMVNS